MSLLETLCSLCSSYVLHVLCVFFIFEGLWWKIFGALEAWICKTSPIRSFLKFLEDFELDFSELWDLGRWLGWFLFKCSSYSKVEVLEVPRCFRAWFQQSFYTSKSFLMLLVAWMPWCLPRCHGVSQDVLGRPLFIGV